jgi:pyruvate dehydrogenase E2 component (dihydrolipoamide acetyltransferase)
MPIDILMPALSPTMEKGNLVQWVKAIGDRLRPDDVVAEVETDKATMEVAAGAEGILTQILVPSGTQDVPVRQVIGLIAAENETKVATPGTTARSLAIAAPSGEAAAPAVSVLPFSHTGAQPQAMRAASNGADADRVFASPIARRLIAEARLDATKITASGPHGRIVERDVKAAIAASEHAAKAPMSSSEQINQISSNESAPQQPPVSGQSHINALFPAGTFEEVAHDGMRLTISRRLAESKRNVPHFYLTASCEMDSLIALRRQLNEDAPADAKGARAYCLSINDFIIKALALALKQVPDANVSFTEQTLLRHRHSDISVAVAIPGGLVTPIIRQAEVKSLGTIANEMIDLAARAKSRKLKAEEYQGGTAGLSNLGMYGVSQFAAIINPPQATILAVGAAEQRLIARDGAAATATMMIVTLSADHRALDGATAAQLLSAFKRAMERPLTMLV